MTEAPGDHGITGTKGAAERKATYTFRAPGTCLLLVIEGAGQ
ncbi:MULTISPECIES: hypothetical protein [Cyanophyceae]|nr:MULTISPECIES: hypothetical protein [Cyanophyceae]